MRIASLAAASVLRKVGVHTTRPLHQVAKMGSTAVHHKIVALEGFITPMPDLSLAMPSGHTYTLELYDRTPHTDAAVQERLAAADIAIITICPVSSATLSPSVTPNIKHIAIMASGHDVVDLPSAHKRGIVVSNSPGCNVDAVAEHSIGLYFAIRRRIPLTQRLARRGEWTKPGHTIFRSVNSPDGALPLPMKCEVVGILGYGGVGSKIASLCRGLGMSQVLLAGRKGARPEDVDESRMPFEEVMRTASVLFLCVPRNKETIGMISSDELAMMRQDALLVNVARGDVVDNASLVDALRNGKIAGAATDVFTPEPAGPENSLLLGEDTEDLNLVTTPHTAWASQETTKNYQQTLLENIKGFLEGKPRNVV